MTRPHPGARRGAWRIVAAGALLATVLGCTGGDDAGAPEQPAWDSSWRSAWPPGSERRDVVIISLDTLRADHLGCYGYERPTSPTIDAFAKQAWLFENAYSTSAKTTEAHMSMFTSLHASVHRVATVMRKDDARSLAPGVKTLAELLRESGYETVGFHGGGSISERFGFDRGFDVYRQVVRSHARRRESGLAAVEEWFAGRDANKPFLLFYHTYFVHDPYVPTPPYDESFTGDYQGQMVHRWPELQKLAGERNWSACSKLYWERVDRDSRADVDQLIALYDGAIRELDSVVAELLATIERHAPDAVVVMLSDHGEEFGEHGEFRHEQIYDEILRVPLIVRHPGQTEPVRVEEPVSLIDLAPTVLGLVGIAPIEQFQGRAFAAGTSPRPLLAELPSKKLAAMVDGRRKVISVNGELEYYDLADDPGEQRRLDDRAGFSDLGTALAATAALNAQVAAATFGEAQPEELPEETLEQLRTLGYIE